MEPTLVVERIATFDPEIKVAIVCKELHKDGYPHIHVFLEYYRKKDVRNPLYFDAIFGKHCNITTVKNTARVMLYITKDGNFEMFGITRKMITLIIDGVSSTLAEVAAKILEQPDIHKIALEFPVKFIHYHRGIGDLCKIQRQVNANKIVPYDWSNQDGMRGIKLRIAYSIEPIYDWFIDNFRGYVDEKNPKPLRSKQMWIHGPTGSGKSRFLAHLCAHFRGFLMSATEDFYGGYNDPDIDFIYMDEFYGNKKLYFLNSLLGGHPIVIPCKGGQYTKQKNMPVVICSNMTPQECYPKVSIWKPLVFEAFLARLQIVDLAVNSLHHMINCLESYCLTQTLTPPPYVEVEESLEI